MADEVERSMEAMLPELHDFTKRKIFSSTEVRAIIKKRRHFEYNVRRKQIFKVDYLRYAEYETRLDLLRRKRKKRQGAKKNSVSDFSGLKRIHGIYTRALQRFKNDVSLWSQYIMFCKHSGADRLLGRVYASAVQHNPLCVELWVDAANWEFEHNGSDQSARALLQRAIRLNDQSQPLWKEYLRFELLSAVKLRERGNLLGIDADGPLSDEASEEQAAQQAAHQAFIKGAVAEVLLDSIFNQFGDDWTFILELATMIRSFPGFPELLQTVYDRLASLECASEPKCQVALLAQMHLDETPEGEAKYLQELRAQLEINPESNDLWGALFDVLCQATEPDDLLAAYTEADEAGGLNADGYCSWGQALIMCAKFDEAVQVLFGAVEAHENNSKLACALVSAIAAASLADKDEDEFPLEEVTEVIKTAIDHCAPQDQSTLWTVMLQATVAMPATFNQVQDVFKAALLAAPTDDWLRQTYLLWASGSGDLAQVRAVIGQLMAMPHLTENQVLQCARFEQLQPQPDATAIRSVFERGVQSVEESKPLWEAYIAHEQSKADLSAVATLQRRATKCGHNMS